MLSFTIDDSLIIDASACALALGFLKVGAGLTWGEVYAALDGSGRAVVGGGCAGVGVAGFLAGGGIGWLSRRRGVGSDSVLAYEVALPNGTVARTTPGDELHAALGAAGASTLGVVWRVWLRTYDVPDGGRFLYRILHYGANGRAGGRRALIDAWVTMAAATQEDGRASLALAISRASGSVHVFYDGSVAEGHAALTAAGAIEPLAALGNFQVPSLRKLICG